MSKQSGKTAMNVRVLLLIAVFALMCAAVILAGVHAYRVVAKRTQKISDQRRIVSGKFYSDRGCAVLSLSNDRGGHTVQKTCG